MVREIFTIRLSGTGSDGRDGCWENPLAIQLYSSDPLLSVCHSHLLHSTFFQFTSIFWPHLSHSSFITHHFSSRLHHPPAQLTPPPPLLLHPTTDTGPGPDPPCSRRWCTGCGARRGRWRRRARAATGRTSSPPRCGIARYHDCRRIACRRGRWAIGSFGRRGSCDGELEVGW